jgi:type II secretory pathway component PulM
MLNTDISDLTSHERRVLQDAFHEGTSPRRTRGVILSAGVVLLGVVLFTAFGASIIFLAGLTVATIVVSSSEKLVYQRNMEAYESLIRKLVNRLEKAEGVPETTSVDAASMPGVNVSSGYQELRAQRVQLTEAEQNEPPRNWSTN